MATIGNNVKLPKDLLDELETQATSRGISVDEVAIETLRSALKSQRWQSLVARGMEHGRRSGIREDQVVDAVHDFRRGR